MRKKRVAAVKSAKPAEPVKLYLLRHPERGEITVNGRRKYEAVLAASRSWGVPWTKLARECEFIVLAEDDERSGRQ